MGVQFKRFPDFRLDLARYDGPVSFEELLQHFQRLDSGANWLSFLSETADLSAIEVAHFPALKQVILSKEQERSEAGSARQAVVVTPTERNKLYAHFWCNYVPTGMPNPRVQAEFASLEDACRWLELPPGGYEAVAAEIERMQREMGRSPACPSPGVVGGEGIEPPTFRV